MSLQPGTILSHYRIAERIGEGGMGVVYRALDTKLERDVALKVLRQELGSDSERLLRFEREARALASLNHPNIGAIFGIEEVGGVAFIVMELIQGRTLRDRIEGRPLPPDAMLDLAIQIADALDAAHARGVVHRDIKPPNILVTDRGQVKMLDFGLAKLTADDDARGDGSSRLETARIDLHQLTTPGSTLGTITYMSPEQVRGEELDARSDLFSFGAVLYEMATGRCAFSAATSGLIFDAILNRTPPPPAQINPDLPPRLLEIIDRALEKDPRLRYQSAADLRADLSRIRRDSDSGRVTAEPGGRPSSGRVAARAVRAGVRSRTVVRVAGAALALAALGAAGLYLRGTWTGAPAAIDSLAVLPFEYAGTDADGEYLSDGVTEALINSLAKLPDLRVIPRSMVFAYKGRSLDPRRVGGELKVRGLITGRVTQRGGDLTITAELIDASSIAQIWGQQYAREADEILSVPEEIARDVSRALQVRLTPDVDRSLARRYTDNPDAYAQYVRSRRPVRRGRREEYEQAIAAATKALVEDLRQRSLVVAPGAHGPRQRAGSPAGPTDPGFALAYASLARLYTRQAYLGYIPPDEAHHKARAAAEFALQMDDRLSEAQGALAFVDFFYEWDWPAAKRGFDHALAINPDDDETRRDHAWYLAATGRKEDAIREMGRACALNPQSSDMGAQLAEQLFWAGRAPEAEAELARARGLDEESPAVTLVAAYLHAEAGRHTEAITTYLDYQAMTDEESFLSPTLAWFYAVAGKKRQAAAILQESAPGEISPAQLGWVHAALGDAEQAFFWWNRAIDQHAVNMVWLRAQPWFDPLREDPRFPRLLERMKLAP